MAASTDLGTSPYTAERRRALAGKSGWVNRKLSLSKAAEPDYSQSGWPSS